MPCEPTEPTEPSCKLAPGARTSGTNYGTCPCNTHKSRTLIRRKQTRWLHTPSMPTYTLTPGTHRLAHNPDMCVYRCTQPWANRCPTSRSQTQVPTSTLAQAHTHTNTQAHTPRSKQKAQPQTHTSLLLCAHLCMSILTWILWFLACGNTTAERNVLILKFVFN